MTRPEHRLETYRAPRGSRGPRGPRGQGALRLSTWHRRLLYGAVTALWLTGAAWLAFHYFLQVQGDFGPQPHKLEHWWLTLHGFVVFVALLLIGPLFVLHAPKGWKTGRSRRLGTTVVVLLAWLILTGYGLYYFSDLLAPGVLSALHWIAGLAAPLALVFHVRMARRRLRPD